jgi:hypothetical protein
MRQRYLPVSFLIFAATSVSYSQDSPQGILEETVAAQARIDSESASSQLRISQLDAETSELLSQYRLVTQQLDRIRIYNDNLTSLVDDQEEEKVSIGEQLDGFVDVEQGIVPLMFTMIEALEQFVALDMPFQLRERTTRVARLRENMNAADITISEKYRQIMDAYLIETDFGRTIEAYVDTLDLGGVETQVDVLRVGRILLAYQTADRLQTGFFNPQTRQWEALPADYGAAVDQGLRIARREALTDLLRLPVAAAEDLR